MKSIINVLKRDGFVDDENIAYFPEKFPEFTLDEFRAFTNGIFDNEGGGWDNVHKFQEEDAHFETYNIPFVFEEEAFYLSVMYGQGSAWTLMTKQNFDEYLDRTTRYSDEHKNDHKNDHHEIGGEG